VVRLIRAARIGVIAAVVPVLVQVSQRITEARGQQPPPGISYALGVVSLLFFLRALATESSAGPEANLQKDLLWGLAAGAALAIVARLF